MQLFLQKIYSILCQGISHCYLHMTRYHYYAEFMDRRPVSITGNLTCLYLHPGKPDQMIFSWVTQNWTSSVVEYGTDSLQLSTHGSATMFTDGGSLKRSMWVHKVTLSGLQPGQRYSEYIGTQ